jgi:hypothetical protein
MWHSVFLSELKFDSECGCQCVWICSTGCTWWEVRPPPRVTAVRVSAASVKCPAIIQCAFGCVGGRYIVSMHSNSFCMGRKVGIRYVYSQTLITGCAISVVYNSLSVLGFLGTELRKCTCTLIEKRIICQAYGVFKEQDYVQLSRFNVIYNPVHWKQCARLVSISSHIVLFVESTPFLWRVCRLRRQKRKYQEVCVGLTLFQDILLDLSRCDAEAWYEPQQ